MKIVEIHHGKSSAIIILVNGRYKFDIYVGTGGSFSPPIYTRKEAIELTQSILIYHANLGLKGAKRMLFELDQQTHQPIQLPLFQLDILSA